MSDFQSLLHWAQSMQQPQPFMQMQPLSSPSLLGTARDIQTYLKQQQSQQNQPYQQLPPLAGASQATPINTSPNIQPASPASSPSIDPQQSIALAQAAMPHLQSQNGSSGKGGGHGGSITGAMNNIALLLG
ncbi:MAG: hypothetical protein EPO08_17695 [Rhodospirillaceae bacterium]|nr:MAG: hypothetical protein EPO08_17695 [Rhodospirillaceae bacterium]TAL05059.1 MAG: hypothetical protein EPO00_13485 [Chloroflexota bacterium]